MIDVDVGGERRWELGQGFGYSDPMKEDVRVEEESESRAVKSGVGHGSRYRQNDETATMGTGTTTSAGVSDDE